MKAMYTAHATSTGAGRAGHVRTDDGKLELDLSLPPAMGGDGKGTNPEQLFAAGYSACFHSAMKFVAGQKQLDTTDSTVSADVAIGQRDDGPGFKLAVTLAVALPKLDQTAAEELVQAAHQVCPYSHATRGNIDVDLKVTAGA